MNKISTGLHILLTAFVYFILIVLNTFVINTSDLPGKLIMSVIFAVMLFLHFRFFQTHYDTFLNYPLFMKIWLLVFSFVYLVFFNFMVRFKMTGKTNMIILLNSCTFAFPMLLTMLSVLIPNKVRRLSRIIYYCGIVELFAGGIASIISLYYPDLLIKG